MKSTRSPDGGLHGLEVAEGVQRDILPIVEGTTVNTKHGMVRTDHILFTLQARSMSRAVGPHSRTSRPILDPRRARGAGEGRVRSHSRRAAQRLVALTALMGTEGISLSFTDDAISKIADFAAIVNERTENIGRDACTRSWRNCSTRFRSRAGPRRQGRGHRRATVRMLADIVKNEDLAGHPVIRRRLRAGLLALVLAGLAGVACGKKGPPLPPPNLLPTPPADFGRQERHQGRPHLQDPRREHRSQLAGRSRACGVRMHFRVPHR
jgi:predicted small lipoprotein YifL